MGEENSALGIPMRLFQNQEIEALKRRWRRCCWCACKEVRT